MHFSIKKLLFSYIPVVIGILSIIGLLFIFFIPNGTYVNTGFAVTGESLLIKLFTVYFAAIERGEKFIIFLFLSSLVVSIITEYFCIRRWFIFKKNRTTIFFKKILDILLFQLLSVLIFF